MKNYELTQQFDSIRNDVQNVINSRVYSRQYLNAFDRGQILRARYMVPPTRIDTAIFPSECIKCLSRVSFGEIIPSRGNWCG